MDNTIQVNKDVQIQTLIDTIVKQQQIIEELMKSVTWNKHCELVKILQLAIMNAGK